MTRQWHPDFRGLAIPVGLILVAELLAHTTSVQSNSFAAPSAIVAALGEEIASGNLQAATLETLTSALSGLAIGFAIGGTLGILLGLSDRVDRLLEMTVETLRPIPSIALIPVFMLIYGFGYLMEVATVAFAATWPALVLARAAIRGVEPGLFEVARVLRLTFPQQLFKIMLPAVMPRLFVALRLTFGIALIVAVTVEISANTIGLGYRMMTAAQSMQPATMLAYLVWVGFLGWLTATGLMAVQRRIVLHDGAER